MSFKHFFFSFLVVFVQLEDQNKSQNLKATIISLLEEHSRQTRRKRSTNETEHQCQEQEWIAAKLEQVLSLRKHVKSHSLFLLLQGKKLLQVAKNHMYQSGTVLMVSTSLYG